MTVIGAKVPNVGSGALDPGIGAAAVAAEAAGARSVWISDHVVIAGETRSRYPYSADGAVHWAPATPWFEALTACAWVAALTSTVRVGTAVLVLPQREPLLVAKTAATIDALSGGRLVLGVGAGWYREEFEALRSEFTTRGRRMDEAIELMRELWTGAAGPREGEFFPLAGEVLCHPRPARPEGVPILIGGMSPRAVARAGRTGDGWLALTHLEDADPRELGEALDAVHAARASARPPLHTVLRLVGAITPASAVAAAATVREIAALGFDEIVIDPPWDEIAAARDVIGRMVGAVS